MIHHPLVLGAKIIVLLVIIIVLIVLKGILTPEQFKWAMIIGGVVFAVSVFIIWIAFARMLNNPNSKIAQQGILTPPDPDEDTGLEQDAVDLIGKEGYADTNLRPAGVGVFDDQRVHVLSDGQYIMKGARIKITEVRGNKVKVKKV